MVSKVAAAKKNELSIDGKQQVNNLNAKLKTRKGGKLEEMIIMRNII